VAGILFFVAVARLPLGTTTLLNCTSPAFAALFAALLLRERIGPASAAALLVSGAGVTIVLLAQGATLGGSPGWQLVALLSGVAAGAGVVATRAARRTDGPWEVFALFCVVGVLLSVPVAAATWRPVSLATAGWLLGVGLTSLAGQLLLTRALGAVEATLAVTIAQLTVVVAAALGVAIHDDPVTRLILAGGVLTVAGVVASAWLAARPAAPRSG
jgi:drug/metabolite transporter (DMT)-like permease